MAEIFHLKAAGLVHPEPVEKTRQYLAEEPRGPLAVELDDETSAVAVAAFLDGRGLTAATYRQGRSWLVLGHAEDSPEILVWYGPDGWRAAMEEDGGWPRSARGYELEPAGRDDFGRPGETPEPGPPEVDDLVVVADRRVLGRGDDRLGAELARLFFDSLAASGRPPRLAAFLNGGVYLTAFESDLVEALRDLEIQGTEIITCGLSLQALGLTERPKVGRLGRLDEIVEAQRRAGRVLRL